MGLSSLVLIAAGLYASSIPSPLGTDLTASLDQESRVLVLPSAAGSSRTAVRDRVEWFAPESFSFVGHLDGEPESSVVIAVHRGAVRGIARSVAGDFRIRGREHEPLHAEPLPQTSQVGAEALMPHDGGGALSGSASSGRDDGTVLDLLMVYTPSARRASGGAAAIEALIHLGVSEANLALDRSGAGTRLRLVYLGEISYQEAFDVEGDLELLRREADGAADRVHRLREMYGADLVQMVAEQSDDCGISYQLGGENPGFESWAFSVVARECIDVGFAIAHEVGHNLGSDHAPEDPISRGAFPFSHGYKDFLAGFRTVMSYGPGRRIARFSNPRQSLRGWPLGGPRSDNARSIRITRTTVAGFRKSRPLPTMTEPRAGAFLNGPVWRFEWTSRQPVEAWRLVIGASPGGREIFDSGSIRRGRTIDVTGVGGVSGPVHVRLWVESGGAWSYRDWRYRVRPEP